ncbi:hypothetical protein WI26_19975 [Burkholderia diffusa]|nr:hypothetical protein WI26_19975 [Burkholderia diffusa]
MGQQKSAGAGPGRTSAPGARAGPRVAASSRADGRRPGAAMQKSRKFSASGAPAPGDGRNAPRA